MTRHAFSQHVADTYGIAFDAPFADDPETWVFRHPGNRKWFAIVLPVPRSKFGLPGDGGIDVVNLKCDPLLSGSLFAEPGIWPAYHMNKEKWISVALDGSVETERICWLLDHSYELTMPKPKKQKGK